jgi:AsmA-like protein
MRRLLVIAGVVVLVLVAAVFAALEALAAGVGKDRVAAALSSALDLPVSIGSMSVTIIPSPAVNATGIRIGAGDVSLATLRVVPDLFSLLPGRTKTINRVDLVGLMIAVRRDRSGHWLIPVPPPPTGAAKPAAKPSAPSTNGGINLQGLHIRQGAVRIVDDSLGATNTITAIEADLQAAGGDLNIPRFTGQLGKTVVTGSAASGPAGITLHLQSASIANSDLPALFGLAGMRPYPGLTIGGAAPFDMTTKVGADLQSFSVTGKVAIERVQLGTIALQALSAPFRFDKRVFTLDPIGFTLYGGKQQGHVSINMATPASYAIKTDINSLDVDQALSATTTMKHTLTGTARLSANVHASGATQPAIQQSLAGTTGFAVTKGALTNFPILAKINQALGITGGSSQETTFDSLTGTATIANSVAHTNDLTLRAGQMTIAAQGTYGLDQSVNMKAVVTFSAAKANQLAQLTPLAKNLQNAQGEIAIPVTVTGTASAPKFGIDVATLAKKNLPNQLIKQGINKLLPH